MASDADVRAVLREHGEPVPARGKLKPAYHQRYEELTNHAGPDGTDDPDGSDDWDGPDDDGDIITATVPAPPAPEPDRGPPADETRPKRPRRKTGGIGGRLFGDKTATAKPKAKVKHPRVPADRLISRGWGALGRIAATVSAPLSTTFALQQPVAGMVLEDAVRGTFIDPALQFAARAEERGEKVAALAGPPLIVLAIERAQGLPEPARTIRLAILEPMLVETLTLWVNIAGDKMATAAARLEEDRATREEVARYISLIFPRATVEDVNPDDAGVMAGAGM